MRNKWAMAERRGVFYVSEVTIDRSPEEVFDFCSDLRNEQLWNPTAEYVHKLTDGPVGLGTWFEAKWSNTGPVTIEVTSFERPDSWETRSRVGGLEFTTSGTVHALASGSLYRTTMQIRATGLAHFYAPLVLFAMRRREAENQSHIKEALEAGRRQDMGSRG